MHKGGSGLGLQACGARRRGDGGLQCGEATAGFAKAERKFMATDARSGGAEAHGARFAGTGARAGAGRLLEVQCRHRSVWFEVSGSQAWMILKHVHQTTHGRMNPHAW